MQKILFICAICILGYVGYIWYENVASSSTNLPTTEISIAGKRFTLEVADSYIEKSRGLSGRETLLPGTGMLFLFPENPYPQIWMKDMNFSIDILFVNAEGEIVEIIEGAIPESYFESPPRTFKSIMPSRYVIELPAGTVSDEDIRIGTVISDLVGF